MLKIVITIILNSPKNYLNAPWFEIIFYNYLFEFIIKIKSNEDLTQIPLLTYVFGLFLIDLQLSHCIHLKHACLNENSH